MTSKETKLIEVELTILAVALTTFLGALAVTLL